MKIILTLFIVVSLVFSLSLNANQQTNAQVINDTIPCNDVKIKCGRHSNGNHVIRNVSEYQVICYGKPDIDFNKYTLLCVDASAGGCKPPTIEHYLLRNKQNGEYQFTVKIKRNGMCKMLFALNIFCLVPKMDNASIVNFSVDRE